MNSNYTSVCYYCGNIYTSNKSTSKYCCPNHNSLYHLNGAKIENPILTSKGTYVDYSDILLWICIKYEDESLHLWSKSYSQHQLHSEFSYDGPLPMGSELILVGYYLIKKMEMGGGYPSLYCVKMIHSLTKSEKAMCTIVKGSFDKELMHNYEQSVVK